MGNKLTLFKVGVKDKNINDYRDTSPQEVDHIKELASQYQGLKITHVNATALGGGVAEMLKSLVPLQNSIGLASEWYVIPPEDVFFEVTKSIHNYLQGKEGVLSKKQRNIYLEHNKKIARLLEGLETDILFIHDPQPAASLSFMQEGQRPKHCIWRCHIDTTKPNDQVWDFFQPFWDVFDHYIFTLKDYAHSDFSSEKLSFITPVIDPLSEKNKAMRRDDALELLKKYGIDVKRPFVSQISRYDPWKDPIGVIDAFMMAKEEIPDLQLILTAQMADDDPEGLIMFEKVKDHSYGKDDIRLIVNDENNELLVNSLQSASTVIMQKSIREGFGLTVTEAMWKKSVVIGGNVGGIKLQIDDGVNGFLVNNVEQAAQRLIYCLQHQDELPEMGEKAKLKVKENYLTPHLMIEHLRLIDSLLSSS